MAGRSSSALTAASIYIAQFLVPNIKTFTQRQIAKKLRGKEQDYSIALTSNYKNLAKILGLPKKYIGKWDIQRLLKLLEEAE